MSTPPRTVVLLHGLGRSPASFWRMRFMLKKAGFEVESPGYVALQAGHGRLSARLADRLPEVGRLDFVGHSLGGLLALRLLDDLPPARRGRVVQLGSPNLGSAAAEKLRPLGQLVGPILEELEPHSAAPEPRPGVLGIAGTAAPDALGRVTGIEGRNDGLVSVESALAAALPENRLVLPVTHTLMMMDRRVIDAVVDFLSDGALNRQRVSEGYE